MALLSLTELIDPAILQEIQDGFAKVTGMAALTTDATGTPVTSGSCFTDFCMKHTRQSKLGCKRCEECDKQGGEITQNTGKAAAYVCHAGLMDFAAPIELEGEFIGSFIGGQVLTEQPDDEKYRAIARELDIDEDEFISALHKVNVVPKERIEAAASFLQTISKVLSSMAYSSFNASQMNTSLRNSIDYTSGIINEVRKAADLSTKAVKEMDSKFRNLAKMADQCKAEIESCNDIVHIIQDNATTTHILGLNASIEASRAKEDGKGFGVIAQEVRSLADTSKNSADIIKRKIAGISESTNEMADNAQASKELVEQCLNDIEMLKNIVLKLQERQGEGRY